MTRNPAPTSQAAPRGWRTRLPRLLLAALLGLALPALALLPAAQAQTHETRARGGTLNFVVTPEPTSLINLTTTATNVLKVSAKVTEGLLDYDFSFRPKPQLATAWEVGGNGLRYTFHLRHGVKWQDGQPFTSADVAFSIDALRKVHPRARKTFENVTSIATPDPDTVVITLSQPAPYLLKAFSATETPIIPKHLYEGTDILSNPHNNAPVGTGPFRFVKWVRGSYIEYERNPDYWDPGKPYLDRIIVKIIADPQARTVAFENGSVDLGGDTPVPVAELDRLRANPKLSIETRGYEFQAGPARIEFNLDNPILKHPDVRAAIASAIDREVIRKVIYYGYAKTDASPLTPDNPYYDPTPTPWPFDLARANQLLDQAGFPRKADGTRFALVLDPLPIGDLPGRTALYVKSALAKIGIAVTVRNQDLPAYLKRVYSDRDFDFLVNGMSNLFDPTAGVARLYTSDNFRHGVPFTNGSHYSNPKVDQLFAQAAVETDEAKRRQLFSSVQRILEHDLPDVNLVIPQNVTIASRAVRDHTISPDGVSANFADVWLQPH